MTRSTLSSRLAALALGALLAAPATAARVPGLPPEHPGALLWLEAMQDRSSPARDLVCSQEGDDQAQTFNNSLVAIAFMVKGERARAERILDFYARAMHPANTDTARQDFFLAGRPRGFYQHVSLRTRRDEGRSADRWIGDLAWLLIACKQHEARFASRRYAPLAGRLEHLLLTFYTPAGDGGYVRHGWRHGDDHLHEAGGHHEGNIDCWAAFRMCGEDSLAARIRTWLDRELAGREGLPLDLYTWRVLAFGCGERALLDVPENDARYRKTVLVNGREVTGFFHGADDSARNLWVDGTGHMACAYAVCGDTARASFYLGQLERLFLRRTIGGRAAVTLPYTANRSAGYEWVDPAKGFTSCVAWYLLAANACDPLVLPGRRSR